MTSPAKAWAIIAGGGTAGHVTPGLSIAREIERRGVPAGEIQWVGSERGIEARLVPEAGFPLVLLPGRGIQRRLTVANVGAILGLIRAMLRAFVLVRRSRPAVVVGLGGYASVPCVLAAAFWRVPIVVAEQNAVPGAANRLAARFAKACALSFPDTELRRGTWTGNPVRPEILAVDRAADSAGARDRLGVPEDRRVLAVFGGSLGARRINHALLDALTGWRTNDGLSVRLIGGRRDFADLSSRDPVHDADQLHFSLVEYEDDMPSVLAAADLVVCRSGASTVAELAAIGVPAVLVPLPGAPGDHQTANARALVDAGAAVMVADGELDGTRLRREVDAVIGDPRVLDDMSTKARRVARRDAAEAVVDLVAIHARRSLPDHNHAS